jgi:hypothetical protein
MIIDEDKNKVTFESTGKTVSAYKGIISIDHHGTLREGYDDILFWGDDTLNEKERVEIADVMIGYWEKYKDTAAPERGCHASVTYNIYAENEFGYDEDFATLQGAVDWLNSQVSGNPSAVAKINNKSFSHRGGKLIDDNGELLDGSIFSRS